MRVTNKRDFLKELYLNTRVLRENMEKCFFHVISLFVFHEAYPALDLKIWSQYIATNLMHF